MILLSIGLCVLGIALLYWGGEVLVGNAIALARHFGVSSMVIGLTVVAFSTSAPELAAAMIANLSGSPDIAIGNAVGSNIANIALILGLTALFFAVPAAPRFVRREVVFMLLVSIVMYPIMLHQKQIGRIEGLFLLGLLAWFLRTLIKDPDSQQVHELPEGHAHVPLWRSSLGVGFGVLLLVAGAKALVDGATDIALAMGVPERVIGLTLVAVGTSLPELAASIVAARKGEGDLVMGNIVGSNIFNLLCILGLTAVVSPIAVAPQVLSLDLWVMIATAALLLVILHWRQRLTRIEAIVLMLGYGAYAAYIYTAGPPPFGG